MDVVYSMYWCLTIVHHLFKISRYIIVGFKISLKIFTLWIILISFLLPFCIFGYDFVLQQEDLNGLGRAMIALVAGNLQAARRENISNNSLHVFHQMSSDMRNLITHLLGSSVQQNNRLRSINDVMPMIGARFYSQLETAQMKNDLLENEFSKELENGRLFRLLCKLNSIIERAE